MQAHPFQVAAMYFRLLRRLPLVMMLVMAAPGMAASGAADGAGNDQLE